MGKGCSWDILDQNKISNWSIYSLKLNFAILIQIVKRFVTTKKLLCTILHSELLMHHIPGSF